MIKQVTQKALKMQYQKSKIKMNYSFAFFANFLRFLRYL
jgi:hypothetical protein